MSDSENFTDGQDADDLRNSSSDSIRRRVTYIGSLDCIQKCDCLPKAKGRVVYTLTFLELDLDTLLNIDVIL